MILYIFYFTLHNFNIKTETLEKIIFSLGIVIALAYIIQYLVYPVKIFDVGIKLDRGTIRIYMPGMIFHYIAFLYSFGKILNRFNIKYLVIFVCLFAIFILYGSRSIIINRVVSIIIMIILSKNVKSKYIIGFLSFSIIVLIKRYICFRWRAQEKRDDNYPEGLGKKMFYYIFVHLTIFPLWNF